MTENGCVGANNEGECLRIVSGLFQKGLHAGVTFFTQALRDTLGQMNSADFRASPAAVMFSG